MASEAVTSSELRLAANDGGAMFFHDSLDFSSYAGALGDTTYMAELVDSTGKKATGYCAAAGAGETLGSELVTNGDFSAWTGDNPDNWLIMGTENANNFITESPSGSMRLVSDGSLMGIRQANLYTIGRLYKNTAQVDALTGKAYIGSYRIPRWDTEIPSTGAFVAYGTSGAEDDLLAIARVAGNSCDLTLSEISSKQVLTPSASGLHLVSTLDGSTKNMASFESGFNPNAVVTVRIYKVK